MGVSDSIAQTPEFQAFASRFGLTHDQAAGAADALLPAIMGGFTKQVQAGGGLGAMLGMLGGSGLFGGAQGAQALDAGQGNEVLGQIFGSKDVSRAVAQDASARTGLDVSLLKQMLPVLVSLVTAYMARQGDLGQAQAPSGGLAGMLGGLLGGGAATPPSQQGASPLSGIAAMLDANGDGNALDDIMRMAGKALR
ncbi:DUF937 domain-containing protein [Pusillimonas sp.]|uniref:DUF937 domain-containing protein n=1 Tax=Pusillimonas sp. TaxID=3040095 RepID=UPI0029A318A2|nr:DUF937 domain-containing protein [Pusillimonas sp.]MDX3895070.1 DUF937 domain-containing protein [Pusillimonas sp.]